MNRSRTLKRTTSRTRMLQQLQAKMNTNGLRGARGTMAVGISPENVAQRVTAPCLRAAINRSRTLKMTTTRTRTLPQLQAKMSTNGLRGARGTMAVGISPENVAQRVTALCSLAAMNRSRTLKRTTSRTRMLQQLQAKTSTNGLRGARGTMGVGISPENVAQRVTALCLR